MVRSHRDICEVKLSTLTASPLLLDWSSEKIEWVGFQAAISSWDYCPQCRESVIAFQDLFVWIHVREDLRFQTMNTYSGTLIERHL